MERPLLIILLLVGYAYSYEWHFGNDNPNYVYIEYLDGKIWPLGKSTRVTISVPPCMLVKYVWVAVVNLISNPSVTYNKDTFTVMIEYGLLSSSTSGYHVVAKGMRDPACGGGGKGGGDPHCPIPVCPHQHCSLPDCPPPNCILPHEAPKCPPSNCPPIYCPPPSCPPPNCPRIQCEPTYCPVPSCAPAQCYHPYVPAHCPRPYCPGCPRPQCNSPPSHNRYVLSGKKLKKANVVKLTGGKNNGFGRQREHILDYIDDRGIYNATGTLKKRYEVIDGNGNIMDHDAYDFEDDDDSEDLTDFVESDNVKPSEVKNDGGGEKHDLMLLIVSDKKGGKQVAGDRNDGHGRGNGFAIGSRPTKKILYTINRGYNKGSGYDGDGLYGGNTGKATGSGKVKSTGYIKGVRYDWGNENAEDSVYSERDQDEHKVTVDYGGNRDNSGGSEHENSDNDRDWGYGYDANVFYPRDRSKGRASSGNDRGSNNGGGSALCSSYYNAKSGYGGNTGNGKGSTYTSSDLCDENAKVDDGFVVMDQGSGYGRIDGQVLDSGYGST